jgi:hypothetical protein
MRRRNMPTGDLDGSSREYPGQSSNRLIDVLPL